MRGAKLRLSAGLWPALIIFVIGAVGWLIYSARPQSAQAGVFELALPEPEFNVAPTAQPEIAIPSPNVNIIEVHILRPQADRIDYGQITAAINGEGAAGVFTIAPTPRGKVLRFELSRLPGFRLVPGRNTVEVFATNQGGRVFYASFVIATTSNRLERFNYQTFAGPNSSQKTPPEIALLEPEGEVVFPAGRRSMEILISGVATAATKVVTVTIGGKPATLQGRPQMRRLGLSNEANRVAFETRYTLAAGTARIPVEAIDAEGVRTQLQIPVRVIAQEQPLGFRGRKYALMVGVSRFKYPNERMPDLKYADKDAHDLYEFLQTPGGGRFAPEDMLLLTNEDATLAKFRQSLSEFVTKPGTDDLLVIFLATHGGPDPMAQQNRYFVLHDTQYQRLADTALPMPDLRNYLQQNIRAKRMLLLVDTCESAGMMADPTIGARGPINNLSNLYLEKLLYREEGRAIITASDVNESSLESAKWGDGHGVFTHFLLEGMRGKADANEDRLVTVGELFRFVRQSVRTETQYNQNPRLLVGDNENLKVATVTTPNR